MRRSNAYHLRLLLLGLVLSLGPTIAQAQCGNSILDVGEACDDGNVGFGDGCSATCQVESGWFCSLPVAPDNTNLVADPGFEAGPFGGVWTESSVGFGTPICSSENCFESFQRSGSHWAWFGGVIIDPEEALLSQSLVLPDTVYELSFWLRVDLCDSGSDFLEVLIDDIQVWQIDGNDPACGGAMYSEVVVDISGFADGAEHELSFHVETFSVNDDSSDFHVDDVYLPQGPLDPLPSVCKENVIFSDGFEP